MVKCRLNFTLYSWNHCILSYKMSSSFSTLFLIPLHSFVLNVVFIFHQSETKNVFIFHFILRTTAFTAKCRLHFPLYLQNYYIFAKMSSSFNTFLRSLKGSVLADFFLVSNVVFIPETHYSILVHIQGVPRNMTVCRTT